MAENEQVIQLPVGFQQFPAQVAGHTFEVTKPAAVGLLQDATAGRVLKPLGKPECAMRELHFYESLASAQKDCGNDPDRALLAELAAYVPSYYEKLKLIVNQREHMFVKLEDLTRGMKKPCVIDIKIGKRTWDPLASETKRAEEQAKYINSKPIIGLCLPGFQVYRPAETNITSPTKQTQTTDQTVLLRYGKEYGKSLGVKGFTQTLAMFFNTSSSSKCRAAATNLLLSEVLRQLYCIRSWFKRQDLLHFYASSLLICYDFEQLQRISSMHSQNGHRSPEVQNGDIIIEPSDWIRVRMIDFAHVFPAKNGQLDDNYLFGLENLIDVVKSLLYE